MIRPVVASVVTGEVVVADVWVVVWVVVSAIENKFGLLQYDSSDL